MLFEFLARSWGLSVCSPHFILHQGRTVVRSSSQFEEQGFSILLLKNAPPDEASLFFAYHIIAGCFFILYIHTLKFSTGNMYHISGLCSFFLLVALL